jgi:3-mercaptopyruvate sulfurtransferase SseA
MDKGFTLVRPLAGGLEAWARAGYPLEADTFFATRPVPPERKAL